MLGGANNSARDRTKATDKKGGRWRHRPPFVCRSPRQNENRTWIWTVRGAWYPFATPKPAPRGNDLDGMSAPFASNGRFWIVLGSFGVENVAEEFRPVMIAEFGALNASTRS